MKKYSNLEKYRYEISWIDLDREDIVKLLLEKGAHKYDTDHYDHTAEAWARAKGSCNRNKYIKLMF